MRNNKGKNHRYTVDEKIKVLEMLDSGLSQVDIEIAKGIPSRTISRWKSQSKLLHKKMQARNGDTNSDNDRNVTNTKSEPDQNGNKDSNEAIPDNNDDKPDIKPDTQDTTKIPEDIKDTTATKDIDEAFAEGVSVGHNDAIEEAAEASEKAAKEYVAEQDEKTRTVINEAKNAVARVKVNAEPSKALEEPLPEPQPQGIIETINKYLDNPWVQMAAMGAGGLLVTKLIEPKKDSEETTQPLIKKLMGKGDKDNDSNW
jgi:hypothetical protein